MESGGIRCAELTRDDGVDPVGTAGSYAGYLLVEQPLPWPRDVGDHPGLAGVAADAETADHRLQAVVPPADREPGVRRVVRYRRRDGIGFGGFVGAELVVPVADVAEAARALLDGSCPGQPVADRDVLVCTHGARDRCCGSSGTSLYLSLPTIAGHRVWRTSHTGGHRFAPTAITIADGCGWAYLDDVVLPAILRRELEPSVAADHLRGCSGLASPELQAADREAFRLVGWPWLEHRRDGTVVARDGDRAEVELTYEAPDGTSGRFRAEVAVSRRVPVPDCGALAGTGTGKASAELAITSFARA